MTDEDRCVYCECTGEMWKPGICWECAEQMSEPIPPDDVEITWDPRAARANS